MQETDTPESLDMEENDNQIDVMFSQVSFAATSNSSCCSLAGHDDRAYLHADWRLLMICQVAAPTTLPRSTSALSALCQESGRETWAVSLPGKVHTGSVWQARMAAS